LCFGGFFRLSSTTLVTAGAIAEFRARRRASVAASNPFFFGFFDLVTVAPLAALQNCAVCLPAVSFSLAAQDRSPCNLSGANSMPSSSNLIKS